MNYYLAIIIVALTISTTTAFGNLFPTITTRSPFPVDQNNYVQIAALTSTPPGLEGSILQLNQNSFDIRHFGNENVKKFKYSLTIETGSSFFINPAPSNEASSTVITISKDNGQTTPVVTVNNAKDAYFSGHYALQPADVSASSWVGVKLFSLSYSHDESSGATQEFERRLALPITELQGVSNPAERHPGSAAIPAGQMINPTVAGPIKVGVNLPTVFEYLGHSQLYGFQTLGLICPDTITARLFISDPTQTNRILVGQIIYDREVLFGPLYEYFIPEDRNAELYHVKTAAQANWNYHIQLVYSFAGDPDKFGDVIDVTNGATQYQNTDYKFYFTDDRDMNGTDYSVF